MATMKKYKSIKEMFMKESKQFLSWSGVVVPGKRNFFYFLRKLLFLYCIIPHNVLLIYDIYYLINDHNFTETVYYVCFSLLYIVSCSKCFQWYMIKEKFNNLLQNIEDAMPEDEKDDEIVKEIIKTENIFKKRSCYVVVFVCCLTVSLGYTGWLVSFIIDNKKFWVEQTNEQNETAYVYTQHLPYPTSIPFDYRSSKIMYFIMVTIFSYPTANYIFAVSGIDSTFFSFTCFACLHFNILKYLLTTIYERNLKKIKKTDNTDVTAELNTKMEMDLRKLIIYLEKVLELCRNLEENYNKVILMQTLSSVSFTALTLLILMVTPMTDKKYPSEVLFTCVCLSIIFFYCFFGNRVTTTAEEIPFALYDCNWFSANKSFIKSMLIIMTRMYKPIYITIGSISPITLATFVSITKTGYSFLAVFKKGKTFQKLQESNFNL